MKNYILFPIDDELFYIYKKMVKGEIISFVANADTYPYCTLARVGVFVIGKPMAAFHNYPNWAKSFKLSQLPPRIREYKENGQCFLKVEIDG